MTRRTRFLILGILCVIATLLLYLVVPAEAQTQAALQTQTPCTGVTEITAVNSYANIRDLPNITTSVITGRLDRGVYKATDSLSAGWYHLAEGGYVSESVTVARCVVPTPTRTPTVRPSPTRIPSATPGPTATPRRNVWIEFGDGTIFQCDLPCKINVYDELPTLRP